jgi:molecular chaperone IbpA
MRTYDFSPLWRSTVGFDRMFDLINNEVPTVQDTYPPYDIERTGDESFRISVALAGFAPEHVTVTSRQNRLTITGKGNDDGTRNYIFQGISTRGFERHFGLADYVEVEGATFDNGLLHVDLVRRVPEAMKPRRIAISVGQDTGRETERPDSRAVKTANKAA